MADDRRSALSVGELALLEPLLREQQRVRFNIRSTARRRCERVVVTLETTLGALRADISAAALGITALESGTDLPLDLGLLPAGATTLTLTPIDRAGRSGSSGSISFETPAGEIAERPRLVDVHPEREVLRRPGRPGDLVTARVLISAWPGSHPIVSVHVIAVAPDGSEAGVLLPPPSPTGFESSELVAALLDSSAGLGSYELRVTVIDSAGSTSDTRSAAVTVTDDDGAPGGPTVDAVEPSAAAAGDIVKISGGGFEARGLWVEVASVVAHVLDIAADGLTFAMPDVDRAGPVVVRTAGGTGSSEVALTPRITLRIVPSEFEIHEGGEIQLVALVTGTADQRVTWTADPSRATIDPTGRLTAVFAGTAGRIAVRAAPLADPESSASATGRVIPMPPREGPVAVGANGGIVLDRTGGLGLTVPRGALAEPATIEVQHVAWVRGGDWSVAAEARIEPSNLELARPARLELPLRVWHDPGSRLAVKHQVDPSDPWEDVERPAIVDATGFLARLEITRFGGIRLDKPFPMFDAAVSPLPSITGVGPPAIEEGATVAILVTGQNFVPGFTSVAVVDAGLAPDLRMEVRGVAVTVDGTKLATTIKAGVMTDLAEGSTRQCRLVVETPAGSDDVPITVLGRDELDVSSGTRTVSFSRRFSRMDIGQNGTLNITNAHPPLTIEVNERAVIRSRFTSGGSVISRGVAGGSGTHGDIPGTGGNGGVGGGGVGAPGLGRGGGGGSGGGNGNSAGGPGAAGGASPTMTTAGAGGLGGSGGGGGLAPHAGGDGTPGSAGTRGPSGLFPPVLELGPGGGGGGAGGGEGWIFTHHGGGGGGGGAGGGAFRICAGEDVLLLGDVFALGGDGGFGGDAFAGGVSVFAPYRPGRGAGGGGGAGGAVELSGVRQASGMVVAVGGANRPVAGGALQVNTNTPLQTILQQRPSGVIRIDGEMPAMTVPSVVGGPDLGYLRELVSTSPHLVVSGFGAQQVRVLNPLGVHTHATAAQPGGGFTCDVLLFDEFNDLWADAGLPSGPTGLMTNAAIRSRTVIHLPNTVSSYSFSCSITPAQVTVPTERSVTLSASVTASQPSPIEWGFVTTGTDVGALIGLPGDRAQYTAPCSAPAQPVVVAAASRLVPTFSCTSQVDIIPGVTLTSMAAVGIPAYPAVASANVGQTIAVTIPRAAYVLTQQGFSAGDAATFRLVERTAAGHCQESTVPIQGNIGPGSPTALEVTVPACAHPDQQIRVPGHGCVRLLVVPTITSLDLDPAIAPGMVIKGTGFVCGATSIAFAGAAVAPGLIVSVTCNLIQLATRPGSNMKVEVSTAGGTSNAAAA